MSTEENKTSFFNPEAIRDMGSCLNEIRKLQNQLEKERQVAEHKEKVMATSLQESKQMSSYLKQLTTALARERKIALEKSEQEKLLWRLIERINSSFDLEQILQATVDELGYYFKVSRCGIIIPNYKQNSKDLVREFAVGEWKRAKEVYSQVSLSILYKKVIKTLKPLVINDTMTHELTAGHLTEDLKSILMVPLLQNNNDLVGVVYLQQCKEQRTWTENELILLNAATNPIATAVSQSKIFNRAKSWAAREKLLNRLTSRIRGTLNIKIILERTVAELGQALQVSRCFINTISPKTSREIISYEFVAKGISTIGEGKENPLIINKIAEKKSEYITITDINKDLRLAKLNKTEQESLKKLGARAILAIPINFQNRLFGWLCFHQCNSSRSWSNEEIMFITAAAAQVAVAINQAELVEKLSEYKSKLSRELKQAAELQSVLLRGGSDIRKNLKIAVSYQPHHNVSGDFYWIHELAPHVVGVLIGDVSGKGPAAALLTGYIIGEIKGLLEQQEYSWQPDKFITALSKSIYEQNQYSDFYATAWYGIFNLIDNKVMCCNAGHPSPYLIQGSLITRIDDNPGTPIGLFSPNEFGKYEMKEYSLKAKDKMIIFTDGLIEQRQLDGQFINEKWLEETLKIHEKYQLDQLPPELIRRLNIISNAAPVDDDRLVVAVEIPETNSIDLNDNQQEIQEKIKLVLEDAQKSGVPEPFIPSLKLGLIEAVYNSLRHGLPNTPKGKIPFVKLSYWLREGSFSCTIIDSGKGFNWQKAIQANQGIKDVDVLSEGGRGLPLLFEIFNQVTWNPIGNELGLKLNW